MSIPFSLMGPTGDYLSILLLMNHYEHLHTYSNIYKHIKKCDKSIQ